MRLAHSSPSEGEVFRAGDVVPVGVAPSCQRAPAGSAGCDNIPRKPRSASSDPVKRWDGDAFNLSPNFFLLTKGAEGSKVVVLEAVDF